MIITQGYMSDPMIKFQWNRLFHLNPYQYQDKPLVVFGVYHTKDVELINRHKGGVIVVWMGKDVLKQNYLKTKNVIHTTWIDSIWNYMRQNGIYDIKQLKIPAREKPNPVKLGDKIYAYLQKSKPEYHGKSIIDQLGLNGQLLVGNHSVEQNNWYNGISDLFYSKCFVGLCLSEYFGGGMSAVEMGLRGIPVITNVIKMSHCRKWETVQDVKNIIEKESYNIGGINRELAEQVYSEMATDLNGFNLTKMLKNEN